MMVQVVKWINKFTNNLLNKLRLWKTRRRNERIKEANRRMFKRYIAKNKIERTITKKRRKKALIEKEEVPSRNVIPFDTRPIDASNNELPIITATVPSTILSPDHFFGWVTHDEGVAGSEPPVEEKVDIIEKLKKNNNGELLRQIEF